MSTLMDAMRSMDVSRSPDLLISYPVSCATSSHTRTFPSPFHMFSYLYYFGPLTCLLTFLAYAFLRLSCRLVSVLTFTAYAFLFYLVDSSHISLFLDSDSSLTHFPFTYVCTCISQTIIYTVGDGDLFPIFNLLCNHPKGVTCEIPCTLPHPL